MMGEVSLFVDDLHTNNNNSLLSAYYYCRICHEAEFESCRKLETPCSCDGTVKYAHRECIQRWCDEKGDITCEICLKKYEPGYTYIPKQPKKIVILDHHVVNIRSSEEPRREEELSNEDILAMAECSSAVDRVASYCRRVALVITVVLLLRYLLEVLVGEARYPFSPVTVMMLRSCGVIIPMCIIIRTISALQNSIKRSCTIHDGLIRDDNYNEEDGDREQAVES